MKTQTYSGAWHEIVRHTGTGQLPLMEIGAYDMYEGPFWIGENRHGGIVRVYDTRHALILKENFETYSIPYHTGPNGVYMPSAQEFEDAGYLCQQVEGDGATFLFTENGPTAIRAIYRALNTNYKKFRGVIRELFMNVWSKAWYGPGAKYKLIPISGPIPIGTQAISFKWENTSW